MKLEPKLDLAKQYDELQMLMELVLKENPELDPYLYGL
jgi:hypothetical protein